MKKRACSLFLALAVMLSLTAVPAGAAESPAVSRNHSAPELYHLVQAGELLPV